MYIMKNYQKVVKLKFTFHSTFVKIIHDM